MGGWAGGLHVVLAAGRGGRSSAAPCSGRGVKHDFKPEAMSDWPAPRSACEVACHVLQTVCASENDGRPRAVSG